ncbi:hypothetical protein SCFA_670007 [anaerobic digester metagenome]|uniref:Uncharacterized protein n=1 Tax=anaerobic digester metagenome TaxID=1263854 RepID=A0A485M3G7_9ZZZZ
MRSKVLIDSKGDPPHEGWGLLAALLTDIIMTINSHEADSFYFHASLCFGNRLVCR